MEKILNLWQHLPYQVNPNIIEWGTFQLRYYSLMYLVAFFFTYVLVSYRIRTERFPYTPELIQDFFFWGILGLILGARLGYVLFYNPLYYLRHPGEIFLPFRFRPHFAFVGISGMSYHGGVLGVIVAALYYCEKRKIDFWELADLFTPAIPLGYTFGRIGNFLNGELYGRITSSPWGMYFPLAPGSSLRHPSQLYEAFFEGVVLFLILWAVRKRRPFPGFSLGLYIVGYGIFRFFLEFFREPDAHLGFLWWGLSMGQILCLLMIFGGFTLIFVRAGK